jgi:hypothetical protein
VEDLQDIEDLEFFWLHGHFDLVMDFVLGFGGDLPPHL